MTRASTTRRDHPASVQYRGCGLTVEKEAKKVDRSACRFIPELGKFASPPGRLGYAAVVLHGLGTTCTEYLIRSLGMHCWNSYDWRDKQNALITTPNAEQVAALQGYLAQAKAAPGVLPAVRIPLTAFEPEDVDHSLVKDLRTDEPPSGW